MKTFNCNVLIAGLVLLVGGCASTPSNNSGTEARDAAVALAANADRDGDSVPDIVDDCADTASRVLVDEAGCEIVMGPINGLNFEPSMVQLPEGAATVLDRYVDAMKRYPDVVVSVEGHTDNRGPAAGNLELSKERVLAVVRYLVSNGVNPARIKPYGYGESRPRAANATAQGREQNRRIEINVLEGLL
ncbi:MAG: OmpA family protein [Granulosicoccus sp.]